MAVVGGIGAVSIVGDFDDAAAGEEVKVGVVGVVAEIEDITADVELFAAGVDFLGGAELAEQRFAVVAAHVGLQDERGADAIAEVHAQLQRAEATAQVRGIAVGVVAFVVAHQGAGAKLTAPIGKAAVLNIGIASVAELEEKAAGVGVADVLIARCGVGEAGAFPFEIAFGVPISVSAVGFDVDALSAVAGEAQKAAELHGIVALIAMVPLQIAIGAAFQDLAIGDVAVFDFTVSQACAAADGLLIIAGSPDAGERSQQGGAEGGH